VRKFFIIALATAALPLVACGTPAQISHVVPKTQIDIPIGQETRPVQFRKVVVKLRRGQHVGQLEGGLACIGAGDLTWRGGRIDISSDELNEVFGEELVNANYTVVGDPNALFEDASAWKAEYLVAGLVTGLKANLCFPWSGYGNFSTGKGEAYMKVDWQIYSRLDRKVVYKTQTEGTSRLSSTKPDPAADLLIRSFAAASQNLLADQGFHKLLTSSTQVGFEKPDNWVELRSAAQSESDFETNADRIQLAVPVVYAGNGHGSGFFVSDEYLLTNEHVVREAKFVKVKLMTGSEYVGEVMKTNSRRDVALVRINSSPVPPISIAKERPKPGTAVYALGAPLSDDLTATVSKGIVSASRVLDGLEYIQSDVNVQPGNSGGPLIDSSGSVVGITVSGVSSGGSMAGLNYFVPIDQAFEALGVNLQF